MDGAVAGITYGKGTLYYTVSKDLKMSGWEYEGPAMTTPVSSTPSASPSADVLQPLPVLTPKSIPVPDTKPPIPNK
jgi:hypothetical protein